MKIDKEVRMKHAQLHSAGHILDLAVARLSKNALILEYPWETGKGYHFPDSPYV